MTGRRKNLGQPEEVIRGDLVHSAVVRLGDLTVGRVVQEPGWHWKTHMQPLVGGEWCQVRHVGVVTSGRFRCEFADGSSIELGPDDVFDVPPGHDAWTVGDEPFVYLAWEGLRTWATPIGVGERTLLTLVFTDIVASTATAARLGERAWSDLLARHNELVRAAIARHRGHEVETTGDGFLATFDGAARAIRSAADVRTGSRTLGLRIRAGVHTGEVEIVAGDVRGIAVHEAARIAGAAEPDTILVSEVTRALAAGAGVSFGPGTVHQLKGLEGPRTLYSFAGFA
ncbi:MAG: adenylate/guanylate cyclase domain-containing protein [Chloroflexi bacterium]|nr:MAG: adenylate/guanylate cyclase domain-containing protein [Chloroflexota bacterium]